jgi:hypothetical protein
MTFWPRNCLIAACVNGFWKSPKTIGRNLYFHSDFLRLQTDGGVRRLTFELVWRTVISTARYVVALDNRRPIRDLEIGAETVLSRWKTLARPAEILVASYLQEMRAAMTLTAFS